MKLKKLIYSVPLAMILLAAGTSCRKSQFNINREPNQPTDSTVTYDVVLPAALHASGGIVANQWGFLQNWMGYWSRSGTYAPNVIEETYQITTTFGNGIWNNCYDNNYDYNIVQLKAAAAGAGFYEGIARIMKAHNFAILVDVYNNVPYNQALKGSANPTPAYDDAKTIYKDLLRQIDAGITLIKNANTAATGPNKDIAKNDIMFGGDKTKWAQFGNSLKLRLLIHAYAVADIDKNAEIAIINAEGSGYLTTDAVIQPGYAADKPMPFYGTYKANAAGTRVANNVYYAANRFGINMYVGDGDPRTARFYLAGSAGLTGVPYGTPPVAQYADGVVANIGPGLYRSATSSQLFFTAAEAYFLRAEARQRGFITSGSTAQQLMESGMLASFTTMGTANPAADLAAYISNNATYSDVDYTAAAGAQNNNIPGGLFTILSQKYFALNGINTLEIWSDYRRVPFSSIPGAPGTASTTHFTYGPGGGYTGGPSISVSPQLPPGSVIPVRMLYPQTEYNYNPANVPTGISATASRVFWDLN